MFATRLRRTVTVLTTLLATLLTTTATARADVPAGWAGDTEVPFWHFVVVLVLVPGALALLIVAVCMAFLRTKKSD